MSGQEPVTRGEVWLRMLVYPRHTLPTAVAPVAVAAGLAARDGVLAPGPAAAALVAGWLIQLGGVFADNYNNLRRHPDDREHPRFVEALRRGVVSLAVLRRAVIGCYVVALVPGAYLLWVGGVPALAVGVASAVASLAYSAGPFPLGDRGLGDPLFFLFFGVVAVAGTYYVQAASLLGPPLPVFPPPGSVTPEALVASVPVAALTTNILVIDNIRDREFDAEKGEITLAVLVGEGWSRVEYAGLLALAYVIPVLMWLEGMDDAWLLLPLLTLPYGVLVAARVFRRRSYEALVPMTPQAAGVVLSFSLLLGLGLAL